MVDAMVDAYITCALWSSTIDDEGKPMDDIYGPEDLAPETKRAMRLACEAFIIVCIFSGIDLDNVGLGPSQIGHDLWLTRNRHGAGFWDRGLGDIGEELSDIARGMGERNMYVGDDHLIYVDL